MEPNQIFQFTKAPLFRAQVMFCLSLTLLYLALFIWRDRLQFPLKWDEYNFWKITQSFSHNLIPTVEQLRSYGSPSTLLAFLFFGYLEYFFHRGIFAGRLLNFILSFGILCLIGMPKTKRDWYSVLAAVGLLPCPYYLFLGLHLYTDIIPTFFVVLGFSFYIRNRHIWSDICFTLAIAGRQYMLPFPVAIAIFELFAVLKKEKQLLVSIRWLAPLVAAATILGWIWFFGGLVPPLAADATNLPERMSNNSTQVSWLFPDHSLYFLACVGLYFVIPEFPLFRRWTHPRNLLTLKNGSIAFVLLLLFSARQQRNFDPDCPTLAHDIITGYLALFAGDERLSAFRPVKSCLLDIDDKRCRFDERVCLGQIYDANFGSSLVLKIHACFECHTTAGKLCRVNV